MSSSISSFDNGTQVLIALRNMKTLRQALYNVTATTTEAICVAQEQRNFTITFVGPAGNAPILGLYSSVIDQNNASYSSSNLTTGILNLLTHDGRDTNVAMCNGIGACNFETGVCQCPPGWGFDPNLGECGRFLVNSSAWTGIGRCVGLIDVSDVGKGSGKVNLDLQPNYPVQAYVSMNPLYTPDNLSAIYLFPWIAEQAWGAELDRGNAQLFLNLTSNQSAGPLVLDSATDRLFFLDRHPHSPFIGFAPQFDNTNSSFTRWYELSYGVYTMAFDAYFGRRKLYWSVPGGLGLDDGAIYWASIDDEAGSVTVYSLTSEIGQVRVKLSKILLIIVFLL